MLRKTVVVVLALFVFGCASHAGAPIGVQGNGVTPFVVQTGNSNGWQTFSVPGLVLGFPNAPGHDGNSWMETGNELLKVSMAGTVTSIALNGDPGRMTPNPDGNMYVVEAMPDNSMAIARITPSGQETDFPIPGSAKIYSITSGSDGNIWMSRLTSIGRLTLDGTYADFPAPQSIANFGPGIVRGGDKNLWVTAWTGSASEIVRVAISDGSFTEYSFPVGSPPVEANDGSLWLPVPFQSHHPSYGIYRFDTVNHSTTFYASHKEIGGFGDMVTLNNKLYWRKASAVQSYSMKTHRLSDSFAQPSDGYQLYPLFAGPDQQLWLTGSTPSLSVLIVHPIIVVPSDVALTVGSSLPMSVSEQNSPQKSFTAVSNDLKVVTVSGSGKDFTVTGVASGSTTITLTDKIGNSLDVAVTVN